MIMALAAKPVVFLGPTLRAAEAASILDATYLPPAAQGDVVRAVQRYGPSCIVIIDGAFQSVPAVRHREILWALHKGIPVVGAASMGALRAAELDRHGMVGVGEIYRWYRRFAFAPDDWVAVLHEPVEFGSQPLTIAHVDLRKTVRKARRNGLIDESLRRRLEPSMPQTASRRMAAPPIPTTQTATAQRKSRRREPSHTPGMRVDGCKESFHLGASPLRFCMTTTAT